MVCGVCAGKWMCDWLEDSGVNGAGRGVQGVHQDGPGMLLVHWHRGVLLTGFTPPSSFCPPAPNPLHM